MGLNLNCMQITCLNVVTEAASEAAYLYAELAHMGADMRYLDCGGGLGIDYDGTASESHSSLPFSIQASLCLLYIIYTEHNCYSPCTMTSDRSHTVADDRSSPVGTTIWILELSSSSL